jgi:hypothetical protein
MLALRMPTPDVPMPEPLRDALCACGRSLPVQVRLGLRSRSRPIVEGRWSCSTRCLEEQVASIVRRERQTELHRRPYRHSVPLGLLLLATGAVKHKDLRHALALQHGSAERIGNVLQRQCGLSERDIANALALQWGCGVLSLAGVNAARAACMLPRPLWERAGMLPVRVTHDDRIHVAFADQLDAHAIFAVQQMHGVAVTAGIAPVSDWEKERARVAATTGVALTEIACDESAEMESEIVRTIRGLQPVESRFIRVHDLYWLRLWLEPLALAGGPTQCEDVVDVLYRVIRPTLYPLT